MERSLNEKIFLVFFFPFVIGFYLIYKYPLWFVETQQDVVDSFYWFGKSTGFWYSTLYTGIIAYICIKTLYIGKTPYGKNKNKELSPYQKKKFISILISQSVFFYIVPYIVPVVFKGKGFFDETFIEVNKNAYVYVFNGFTSMGGFLYIFLIVPVAVWFLGKRYCSWFCACGNLAEAIGVTSWGNRWVQEKTPRGETSRKLEVLQYFFLAAAVIFGLIIFLDTWKIITAGSVLIWLSSSWRNAFIR